MNGDYPYANLVISQHLFGLTHPELIFDISVHVGTLVAVLVIFPRLWRHDKERREKRR